MTRLVSAVLATAIAMGTAADGQKVVHDPDRAARMRSHYGAALEAHAAVIGGDMRVVVAAARAAADVEYGFPVAPTEIRHVAAVRDGAEAAAGSADIPGAAYATARMLNACGGCHRAVGTMPALPLTSHLEVGGLVGHMQGHRHVVDRLLQGQIIPSTTLWRAGAEALASTPMVTDPFGAGDDARREMAAIEASIHRIAADAAGATEPLARASYYGRILAGCADCHTRVGARPGR